MHYSAIATTNTLNLSEIKHNLIYIFILIECGNVNISIYLWNQRQHAKCTTANFIHAMEFGSLVENKVANAVKMTGKQQVLTILSSFHL